jgi:hypothetical protein
LAAFEKLSPGGKSFVVVQVGPGPELSIVTFRFIPQRGDANEFNARLLRSVRERGQNGVLIIPT